MDSDTVQDIFANSMHLRASIGTHFSGIKEEGSGRLRLIIDLDHVEPESAFPIDVEFTWGDHTETNIHTSALGAKLKELWAMTGGGPLTESPSFQVSSCSHCSIVGSTLIWQVMTCVMAI